MAFLRDIFLRGYLVLTKCLDSVDISCFNNPGQSQYWFPKKSLSARKRKVYRKWGRIIYMTREI